MASNGANVDDEKTGASDSGEGASQFEASSNCNSMFHSSRHSLVEMLNLTLEATSGHLVTLKSRLTA